MIFKDIVRKCFVSIVGNPYESFPEKWWTNKDSARNVLLEFAKIVFYYDWLAVSFCAISTIVVYKVKVLY